MVTKPYTIQIDIHPSVLIGQPPQCNIDLGGMPMAQAAQELAQILFQIIVKLNTPQPVGLPASPIVQVPE